MADALPEVISTDDPSMHEAMEPGAHAEHVEPHALGLAPGGWVGLAMLVFLGIVLWKGVHKAITRGLDSKIAAIREQLDEAKKLRAEAEALRAEYAAKIANAEADAAAMIERAKAEAETIVAKAETDAGAVIARRERMAEDKIAAAERAAIEELRARAAEAATAASRRLIASKHGAEADRALVDEAISSL